jgi:hypothetical protein
VLGLLGDADQLRSRGLDADTRARVPATFGTTGVALDVTVSWSSLSVAGGGPRAAGT